MSIILSEGRALSVMSPPQYSVREAVTEMSRQIEDMNWVSLSTDWRAMNGNDESQEDRARLIKRIRMYRRRNPLAKQGANLLMHYTLGQGMNLRAENKKQVARIVDEFWNDPINKAVLTSHAAMKQFLDDVFTDGEQFLVLFADAELGTVQCGTIDTAFVQDIVMDPENHRIPKWYKVAKPTVKFDFRQGTYEAGSAEDFVYYRDWRNSDSPPKGMGGRLQKGVIYHVYAEKRGKRGESQLLAALDWLGAHRSFMEDRSTINRAAAQVAWKKKRKGGPTDVANEVARLRSSLTQTLNQYETNPAPASGSTIVENEGSSLEWVKTDTGGQAATADERILRMMAGSGMGGIPNHYFGDEANANLATATAMELPLLKTYEDWQQTMRDVILNVIEFVLSTANEAGRVGDRDDSRRYAERVTTPQEVVNSPDQVNAQQGTTQQEAFAPFAGGDAASATAFAGGSKLVMVPKKASATNVNIANDGSGAVSWYVDVDFPPIVQKDLTALTGALKSLYEMLPAENVESQKMVVEMFLTALGVNDIDQTMERLYPADMVAVLVPKTPPMLNPGLNPAANGGAVARPPEPAQVDPQPAKTAEVASLAERRVTRLLRLADAIPSAADDVAVASA